MTMYFEVIPAYAPFGSRKEKELYDQMRFDGVIFEDFGDILYNLSNNQQRIDMMYNRLDNYLDELSVGEDMKSDFTAGEYMREGDRSCRYNRLEDGLKWYTKSITKAWNPEVRAMAYSKRAEVLQKWKMYDKCLQDIDRSWELTYDDELKLQLTAMKDQIAALPSFKEAYHDPIPVIPEEEKHPTLSQASLSLDRAFNETYGHHIIAAKTINIGELLMVEEPFACVAFEEDLLHCHECLELCFNPIPCDLCTQTLYCGNRCQTKASNYHAIECLLKRKLKEYNLSRSKYLPIKTAILATRNLYVDNSVEAREGTMKILNMQDNLLEISKDQLMARILRGTIIYHFLNTHTDFFDILSTDEQENQFKDYIVITQGISNRNSQKIMEITNTRAGSTMFHQIPFGGGLYCSGGNFNHSCCPNVGVWAFGSTLVYRALLTIPQGQQCFISYGPHHDVCERRARSLMLSSKYNFQCQCRACSENWLVYREAPADHENGFFLLHLMTASNAEDGRKYLNRYVEQLKRSEGLAPSPLFTFSQALVDYCFRAVANTRRKRVC